MAYTEGTAVWNSSFTSIRPILSVLIPRSSRPMFFVKGRLPVLTSTTSASWVEASPPLDDSVESCTVPSSRILVSVTFVLSLNLNPCFLRIFWKFLAISLSNVGVIVSRNSITVTSLPSLLHTEPISSPITPPPMTAIRLGTVGRSRAPVESTIFWPALSTGQVGRGVTSEPTARMIFLASIVWLPPSLRFTDTLVGEANLPNPLT
mmetsp:Transcript_399/g.748  ORF Transcript_399/g.748 Transcript_399/m.748 type:complete len:206 (-) Transcript_399:465-1082(-)